MDQPIKIALILSGCGVYDGSEIHEAAMTMYSIVSNDAEYEIYAPDIEQNVVINHVTGKPMKEKRNVMVESARIARGKIKPLCVPSMSLRTPIGSLRKSLKIQIIFKEPKMG